VKIDMIQPFVNAVDSVIAEIMGCPAQISDVTMSGDNRQLNGTAATVLFSGEIEGRAILDMDQPAAQRAVGYLSGAASVPADEFSREAVCEVTNMIIGNAVSQLNDRGFQFKVYPPEVYTSREGLQDSNDTEALVLRFETPHGSVVLNVALQYRFRRVGDAAGLAAF
jgi:chemotaxis protein CheX